MLYISNNKNYISKDMKRTTIWSSLCKTATILKERKYKGFFRSHHKLICYYTDRQGH